MGQWTVREPSSEGLAPADNFRGLAAPGSPPSFPAGFDRWSFPSFPPDSFPADTPQRKDTGPAGPLTARCFSTPNTRCPARIISSSCIACPPVAGSVNTSICMVFYDKVRRSACFKDILSLRDFLICAVRAEQTPPRSAPAAGPNIPVVRPSLLPVEACLLRRGSGSGFFMRVL